MKRYYKKHIENNKKTEVDTGVHKLKKSSVLDSLVFAGTPYLTFTEKITNQEQSLIWERREAEVTKLSCNGPI